MSYTENFPTIWDTPRKPRARKTNAPVQTLHQAAKPVKEAFLSIWDKPTRAPAA